MDVSGLTTIILEEYRSHPGIFFENHLYGCLTLLEERLTDASHVDVSAQWQQIGVEHGFFRDPLCIYEGLPLLSKCMADPSRNGRQCTVCG